MTRAPDIAAWEGNVTRQLSIVLTSAFLVLGAMFVVKPGAAIPDQASGMDIAGLTAAATDLPVQQYPAF
jgi:hypothetical protein